MSLKGMVGPPMRYGYNVVLANPCAGPYGMGNVTERVAAAPDWELSGGLQTNIVSYVVANMLSSSLHAYKGEGPINHVLNILKRNCLDMPPGIEYNAAKWKKVVSFVQDGFTERQSVWKKTLKKSIKDTQNIYDVAALLIKKSNCKVMAPLCSCVALMRSVYRADPGSSFWESVDTKLAEIHNKAGMGDSRDKCINKAFKAILKKDREDFGGEDNSAVNNHYTRSDLQVLVEEHIETAI
ncbi:hypothetical protein PILCRDRAFT_8963 [Piloderma croceum F 1598]|uniref:Uncharacterized protein n=1 Tax=Piloderma croceum (strain F 1598) TaxID=765440 RepID=A0A0C3F9H2_PILCF|nr:hypothetical protein PILCRDRAFT_8963 [Piloderma croceum F 1598]